MKEITITYQLSDDQERRIYELLPDFNEDSEEECSIEDVFVQMMTIGSSLDIEAKLERLENILRLKKAHK